MDKEFFTNDHKHTLVFMDLETFNVNLNFYNNRPWQVGMIKVVRKDVVAESCDRMVKWDCGLKISDEALYAYNVYQIEGEGRNLFSSIEGDEDTIMGLPIKKIKEYLHNYK